MNSPKPAGLSAVKIALAVKRLRAETERLHLLAAEPLAIIGMGCRLPGADSPDAFWKMLENGVDAVCRMPEARWPAAGLTTDPLRRGAYFDQVDTFDAEFFGISPREANCTDPQQRFLLEVTWDALADAGIEPGTLAGTQTGVFVAIGNNDYTRLQLRDLAPSGASLGLGSAGCLAAGHLSFLLDTRGPALVVDTACSSSLTAAHLASQSLRSRECNLAIVGAASLKLLPDDVIVCSQWGMLSPNAQCKTFDEDADGFVHGEGCGVIVIKRLADALANGDHIRAIIRGSAVNHDGRTSVMTAPNGLAQEAVIRAALEHATVDPAYVSFIETHGTGTSLGDPIEVEALRSIYGAIGPDEDPCLLGAVKTNLGHLESAAGMAGLIKTVLCFEQEKIPRNLHFERLNPRIQLDDSRLRLAQQSTDWPRGNRPRIAGVSSFGLSGTNSHFTLEEAPQQPARAALPLCDDNLLVLSARSEAALQQLAESYSEFLARTTQPLAEVCANAALHRQHYEYRLAVSGDRNTTLIGRLESLRDGSNSAGLASGFVRRTPSGSLAFVFSGQGSAWLGMGRELVEQHAHALATVQRIDALYSRHAGWSIADLLTGKVDTAALDNTSIAQPLIFALQVALAELLASWGITPDAVAGHSVGELAAAYIAGILSLDEAVRILYHRCDCMQRAAEGGRMLAVALSVSDAETILKKYGEAVVIAAYNTPTSLILSGDAEALAAISAELQSKDVSARWVDVRYAFHSPAMRVIADDFASRLGTVAYREGNIPMISTVTGKPLHEEAALASYWSAGVTEPVRFHQAVDHLMNAGATTFIEIGPGTVLSRFVAETAQLRQLPVQALPTMRKSVSCSKALNHLLAQLYVSGESIKWRGVFPSRPAHVCLPLYPWQHKRYWIEESAAKPQTWESVSSVAQDGSPLLGRRIDSPFVDGVLFASHLSSARPPYIRDQRLGQTPVVPFAVWIELATAAYREIHDTRQTRHDVALVDLAFARPLMLPGNGANIQTYAQEDSFRIAVQEGGTWSVLASGRYEPAHLRPGLVDLTALRMRCCDALSVENLYDAFASIGLEYGPAFRPIAQIWTTDGEALALLRLHPALETLTHSCGIHPVILDGCLQVLGAALGSTVQDLFLPVSLDRYEHFGHATEVWVHARVVELSGEQLSANLVITDAGGSVLASMQGLRARRAVMPEIAMQSVEVLRSSHHTGGELLDTLSRAPDSEHHAVLALYIKQSIREVLALDQAFVIDEDRPMQELGLDSLMAVEIKNLLQSAINQELRSTVVFDHPTVNALAAYLDASLWAASGRSGEQAQSSEQEEIRI